MSRKYFGTDGVRGKVGEYPITPEFVMKLGWAAGKVFAEKFGEKGKSKILIGKDTRISGYMFESALEAGLTAAGVKSGMLGPMPTPGIAYLTRTFHANAGIVISASHNAFHDNGIKFFSADGTKLDDEIEAAIEAYLDQPMTIVASEHLGKAFRITDAAGRYIEYCKSTVRRLRLDRKKIVLDCAHGATYQIAPAVFKEMGAKVRVIGAEPDGLNINRGVGSTYPEKLAEKVLEEGAELGIAFDGDGDRVVMVDHKGEVIDGDELLFIMAMHAKERGRLGGGVVGTLMSNLGLELALKEHNIDFARAKVGDRHVMQILKEKDWKFGGESSGHLLCLDSTTTGDGIISALQVMMAVQDSGKSLHELKQDMTKCPQTMINVRRNNDKDAMTDPDVQKAVAEVEAELADTGRVLLRPSGTEPVVRVMVEGQDGEQVLRCCQRLAKQVEKVLS